MRPYTFILLIVVLCGCRNDDKPGSPSRAQLIFPEENSECTDGISINELQSSITFSWGSTANTDSYRLTVKNLTTDAIQNYTTAATSLTVNLSKGQAYSWFVTSISNKVSETTKSETWKFYNAGEGITSYAPFPAEALYPPQGATALLIGGSVTLQWDGVDVDSDIVEYDVYFNTVNPPTTLAGASVTSESFDVISLAPDTIYYWRIVTTDSNGNTSLSEIFQFRTVN
jgi:hypothetical protein